jgi:hypothetical protein
MVSAVSVTWSARTSSITSILRIGAYPQAQLWGPRSTIRKRGDLTFREPLTDATPIEWRTDLDQAWFKGSFLMDEIVFFHRPSRTVIVADLIEAFSESFCVNTGLGGDARLPSWMGSWRGRPARHRNGDCPLSIDR